VYKYLLALFCLFPISASAVEYLVVTADSVRVREKPGLNGRSMLMLNKGHLVIKVEDKGDWTRIFFKGREDQTNQTEGWMHSSFLKEERAVVKQNTPEELQLTDNTADLACEKVIGTELVQGCDLHLQYGLEQDSGLKQIKVNCSAELVAKTRNGEMIPVPVNQTLEHQVANSAGDYSMHILMKADASYELDEVSLEGHRCQLVGYSK
jgi:hypothetical protein